MSPEKLAWSLAAGLLIGINPVLGSTTVLCLAAAFVFRLNVAASQIVTHLVYPLELLLVIPFLRLGTHLFDTDPMPMSLRELAEMAHHHPIKLIRELWFWEWHALAVWAVVALVATPIAARCFTPLLRRLLVHIRAGETVAGTV